MRLCSTHETTAAPAKETTSGAVDGSLVEPFIAASITRVSKAPETAATPPASH